MIHQFTIIPRYAETDMMGVIHHAVYLVWAEAARTNLIGDSGRSYHQIEKDGIMLPVTEIRFRYKAPILFEDQVRIDSAITLLDNRRLRVDYKIYGNNKLCTIGYSMHVFMSTELRHSIRIPQHILEKFKKYYDLNFQNRL